MLHALAGASFQEVNSLLIGAANTARAVKAIVQFPGAEPELKTPAREKIGAGVCRDCLEASTHVLVKCITRIFVIREILAYLILPAPKGIRMKKMLISAFVVTAITGVARADVGPVQRGGVCFTNSRAIGNAEVIWKCEHIGQVTIRQIYEKGFRVAAIHSTDLSAPMGQYQYLVIEEQRR